MRKITTNTVDEWVKLYQEGETCVAIARKYNVSRYTVSKYLKSRNIEIVKSRLPKSYTTITTTMINQWIEHCKNREMTSEEIAQKYGVNRTTVVKYVNMLGYNFTRNIRHRQTYDVTICLYDENGSLAYCFDNAYEMSQKTGKKYDSIQSTLSRLRQGIKHKMRINNQWYQIELIDNKEIENET